MVFSATEWLAVAAGKGVNSFWSVTATVTVAVSVSVPSLACTVSEKALAGFVMVSKFSPAPI